MSTASSKPSSSKLNDYIVVDGDVTFDVIVATALHCLSRREQPAVVLKNLSVVPQEAKRIIIKNHPALLEVTWSNLEWEIMSEVFCKNFYSLTMVPFPLGDGFIMDVVFAQNTLFERILLSMAKTNGFTSAVKHAQKSIEAALSVLFTNTLSENNVPKVVDVKDNINIYAFKPNILEENFDRFELNTWAVYPRNYKWVITRKARFSLNLPDDILEHFDTPVTDKRLYRRSTVVNTLASVQRVISAIESNEAKSQHTDN